MVARVVVVGGGGGGGGREGGGRTVSWQKLINEDPFFIYTGIHNSAIFVNIHVRRFSN